MRRYSTPLSRGSQPTRFIDIERQEEHHRKIPFLSLKGTHSPAQGKPWTNPARLWRHPGFFASPLIWSPESIGGYAPAQRPDKANRAPALPAGDPQDAGWPAAGNWLGNWLETPLLLPSRGRPAAARACQSAQTALHKAPGTELACCLLQQNRRCTQ